MQRLGIYGGTFNPPHIGHIRAAAYGAQTLETETLLLIPSCISPHKVLPEGTASPQERMEMLTLAASGQPGLEPCGLEVSRGGKSYTYMTVSQLKAQYPDKELVLLMGTDMFLSLLTWREPEKILKNCSLGVFYRGQGREEELVMSQKKTLEKLGATVYILDNPVTEISSTDLRRLLILGGAESYLDPAVLSYIREKGLYGTGRDYKSLPMEKLEKVVLSLLNQDRVAHTLGCRDTAGELAKAYGENVELARRAGLLHDVTKALKPPQQRELCRHYGAENPEYEAYPQLYHALTGALTARTVFGEDEKVVSAIRYHTTGRDNMTALEKILYLADYIEPNRDFPGVDTLRGLAFRDLDAAMGMGLSMTARQLQEKGRPMCGESRAAMEFFSQRNGKKESK